jgi:hypothetical protein
MPPSPPDSVYWKMARAKPLTHTTSVADDKYFMHLPLVDRLTATADSDELGALERELPPPLAESLHVLENPQQLFATRAPRPMAPEQLASDVAASFQQAVFRHLMSRVGIALDWCKEHCPEVNTVVLSGGVARNRALIAELETLTAARGVRTVVPAPELCTDNGVMIAWAGLEMMRVGMVDAPLAIDDPRSSIPDDDAAAAHDNGAADIHSGARHDKKHSKACR